MTTEPVPARSPRFDRIGAPGNRPPAPRDELGKEALFTTAPTAVPPSTVDVRCRRCDTRLGLRLREVVRLLARPFLWDPVRGRLWTRCPACERRACLDVRAGQALRVLIDRGRRER